MFVLIQANTQSIHYQAKIHELFNNSNSAIETFQYKGLLDGIYPIYLAIGKLENEIKGYYQFYSHSKIYYLEGTESDEGNIELFELNEFDDVLGFMTGKIGGEQISLKWHNLANSLSLSIEAKKLPGNENEEVDKLWTETIRVLAGLDGNKPMKFYWNETSGNCRVIEFPEAKGPDEIPISFNKKNQINKSESGGLVYSGLKNSLQLNEITKCSLLKKQWVGDRYLAISEYIRTGNEKFDSWFRQFIDDQLILVIKEINTKFEDDPGFIADDRYQYQAKVSVQLDFLSEDLISGLVWISSNAFSEVQMTPFIYDLNQSENLTLKDLFKSDFNYDFYLQQNLKQTRSAKQKEVDMALKSWIKDKEFNILTFDDIGLKYYTAFSTIYGFEFIHVPIFKISNYIKNKSVKKAFAIN